MGVTLYLRNTATHVGTLGSSGNFDLESTTGTTATQSIGSNGTRTYVYYSTTSFPGLTDWSTATDYTWNIDVTTANANVQLTTVKISRYDSTLATERASASTTPNLTLNTTGLKTGNITFTSPNPAGRASTDRLVITFTITKLAGGGTQSINADVNGSSDSRLATPLVNFTSRPISETSISVSDTNQPVEKLLATRTIAESSVNVSENLTRAKIKSKTISEPSTSVSGSVNVSVIAGAKLFTIHFVEFPEDAIDLPIEIEIVGAHVVSPHTHKFNIIGLVTATKTHKFNLSNAVSTTKTHKFNLLQQITKTKTHLYNLLQQIAKTKTHKWHTISIVTVSKTHKYSIESVTQVTSSKTHKFNVSIQVAKSKTHKYNVLAQVTSTKTHKFNLLQQIAKSKTHKFNLLSQVSATKTHRYNINLAVEQVTSSKTHKWNLIAVVSTSKTHKFSLLNTVTKSKTHIYSLVNSVSKTKTHLFNILARIAISTTHKYNILQRITKSKTHKFNLEGRLIVTKTHRFNVLQKIQVVKTHWFTVLVKIPTVVKTHKYSILSLVTKSKTHKYNIIGRLTTTKTHRWNSGGKVTTTKKHIYDLGFAFELLPGGGTSTVVHIDFPPKIRIVDIIADIRNLAVAEIELVSFQKIICIGVVEIRETPLIIGKTASTYKPRHRIASTLIIPQIIETIENRAFSGRIGKEVLPLPHTLQLQVQSKLILSKSTPISLLSQTQIKPSLKKVINLVSGIQLSNLTHIATISKLELGFLNNLQLIAPEIMAKEYEQNLRIVLEILQNDDFFK